MTTTPIPDAAVEAVLEAFSADPGYLKDKIASALTAALPLLSVPEADEVADFEKVRDRIKARIDGHDYDEPWDLGYKVGLRDAIEDLARELVSVPEAVAQVETLTDALHRSNVDRDNYRRKYEALERAGENVGMSGAIRACVQAHVYSSEIPDDGEAYLCCVCGWRSDDETDMEGAARHLHTHLTNAMHDAVRNHLRAARTPDDDAECHHRFPDGTTCTLRRDQHTIPGLADFHGLTDDDAEGKCTCEAYGPEQHLVPCPRAEGKS